MEVKFTACEHLDFEPKYAGCKRQMLGQISGDGKLFWMRPNYGMDNPTMVQFCKKRGRLNNPESCLKKENAVCSDYKEFNHVIEIEEKEIES